jgi:hypothetical protein
MVAVGCLGGQGLGVVGGRLPTASILFSKDVLGLGIKKRAIPTINPINPMTRMA